MCRLARNSGSLNLLKPQVPVQACTGRANKCNCNWASTKPTDISEGWSWRLPSVAVIYVDDRFELAIDGEEAWWKDRVSRNETALQTGHLYCRSGRLNESQHGYLTQRLVGWLWCRIIIIIIIIIYWNWFFTRWQYHRILSSSSSFLHFPVFACTKFCLPIHKRILQMYCIFLSPNFSLLSTYLLKPAPSELEFKSKFKNAWQVFVPIRKTLRSMLLI